MIIDLVFFHNDLIRNCNSFRFESVILSTTDLRWEHHIDQCDDNVHRVLVRSESIDRSAMLPQRLVHDCQLKVFGFGLKKAGVSKQQVYLINGNNKLL